MCSILFKKNTNYVLYIEIVNFEYKVETVLGPFDVTKQMKTESLINSIY